MSNLLQKERGRASRWIIGGLWGTLSQRGATLDPEKAKCTSGKPRTAMDTKLRPRDTAPRASRPASAQRGELVGENVGRMSQH